jgi:hypothetical protein
MASIAPELTSWSPARRGANTRPDAWVERDAPTTPANCALPGARDVVPGSRVVQLLGSFGFYADNDVIYDVTPLRPGTGLPPGTPASARGQARAQPPHISLRP